MDREGKRDFSDNYEQQQLPVTRQEIENLSMLYHILEDMQAFLYIKKDFITAR